MTWTAFPKAPTPPPAQCGICGGNIEITDYLTKPAVDLIMREGLTDKVRSMIFGATAWDPDRSVEQDKGSN